MMSLELCTWVNAFELIPLPALHQCHWLSAYMACGERAAVGLFSI